MQKTATKALRNHQTAKPAKKPKAVAPAQRRAGDQAAHAANGNGKRPVQQSLTLEALTLEELTLRSFQMAYDDYHSETA